MRGEISNSPSNNSLTFTPDNPCQLSVSERAYFESALPGIYCYPLRERNESKTPVFRISMMVLEL